MKATHFLVILLIGGIIASCGKTTYRKTPGGMPYKVYSSSDTQKVNVGNIIKVHFTRKIKDSVDYTTVGSMPAYFPVSENITPYDLSEVWTKLKKGDSVIATQMMDTFIARNPQFPAFVNGQYKKGDKITITVKILEVFTSDSLAQADEALVKTEIEAKEPALVAKYISDNKINATKLPNGVYVEVISPGNGPAIELGNYVSLNYTGTTFGGKKFDSNTDTTFQHVQPLSFTVGSQEMIKGLSEGVVSLQKDAHVKIYIPSILGYGAQPNPQSGIKPYESLIFDVVILDIKDKAPPAPPQSENPQQPQQ